MSAETKTAPDRVKPSKSSHEPNLNSPDVEERLKQKLEKFEAFKEE